MNPRRTFLQAAAGGILILKPQTVFGSPANSTVEIGLIGCGSRGNWIAPFFPEHAGARVVAVAEVVKSRLDATREKLKVDAGRAYWGPDAAHELAQSKLDAVVIETPPYYHPQHAAAAVDAGRHVFCAKPIAVDVPDCRSFLATGQKARDKGLSFWWISRAARGRYFRRPWSAWGAAISARWPWRKSSTMPTGRGPTARLPAWTPAEAHGQLVGDRVISGDIIVEQNIHVIDMANWYLGGHPLKATGAGGRTDWAGTKSDTGDAWDHFAVTYWYPGDVHATFSSHQLNGRFSDLCVRCFGLKGCADTHYGGLVRIASDDAEKNWTGSEKDDTFTGGHRQYQGFCSEHPGGQAP